MRQPLGSSVTPRPCTPGRCVEAVAGAGRARPRVAAPTGRPDGPGSAPGPRYWSVAMKSTPASRAARQRVSTAAGDAEVVARRPAAIVGLGMAVERVEADPQAAAVRQRGERREARRVGGRPRAGVGLAAALDHRPREVHPAAIVGGAARDQLGRTEPGQLRDRLLALPHLGFDVDRDRAEHTQAPADRNAIVEGRLLRVGVAGQHQHGLDVERRGARAVGDARRRREPRVVGAQRLPDRRVVLRLVGLQVEVEDDERPRLTTAVAERLLDDRPDALEEVRRQRRLGPGERLAVRQDAARHAAPRIAEPDQVLLDRHRQAGRERPVDPITPPAAVRVAVVRVEEDPRAGRACPRRGWRLWRGVGCHAHEHGERGGEDRQGQGARHAVV